MTWGFDSLKGVVSQIIARLRHSLKEPQSQSGPSITASDNAQLEDNVIASRDAIRIDTINIALPPNAVQGRAEDRPLEQLEAHEAQVLVEIRALNRVCRYEDARKNIVGEQQRAPNLSKDYEYHLNVELAVTYLGYERSADDCATAINCTNRAMALRNGKAVETALRVRAWAYLHSNCLAEAIADAQAALQQQPSFTKALDVLILARRRRGATAESLESEYVLDSQREVRAAIRLAPAVLHAMAVAFAESRSWSKALSYESQVVELEPDDAAYLAQLGACHMGLALRLTTATGRYVSALEPGIDTAELRLAHSAFQRAFAISEETGGTNGLRGIFPLAVQAAELMGDRDGLTLLKFIGEKYRLTAASPVEAVLYARQLASVGDRPGARAILAAHQSDDHAQLEQALLLLEERQYDDCDALLRNITARADTAIAAKARLLRIEVLVDQHLLLEARPALESYCADHGVCWHADLLWAHLFERDGDVETALQHLKAAVRKSYRAFPATMSLAQFYARHAESGKALEVMASIYKRYKRFVPWFHADFLQEYVRALLAFAYYDRCERVLAESQGKVPAEVLSRLRARLYWETGRTPECVEALQQCADGPQRLQIAITLAQCYVRLLRPKKAAQMLQEFRARHPESVDDSLIVTLGSAQFLDGDDSAALLLLQRQAGFRVDYPRSVVHPALAKLSLACGRPDIGVPHIVQYHERYPKATWLSSMRAAEGDREHPRLTDEGRRFFESIRKRYVAERELYLTHRLPLSFFTRACACSVASLYARRCDPRWPIWWCSGMRERRSPLSPRTRRILVDYSALLVLANVGLLSRFLAGPWKVIVTSVTIDDIVGDACAGTPLARMIWNDLREAAIVTAPCPRHQRPGALGDAGHVCDAGTAATLLYAKQNATTAVFGDAILVGFAQSIGIKAAEQFVLFDAMRRKGLIAPEEWAHIVIKLVREHHLFVPLSIMDVAFAWRSDGEACGENTEAVFWNEIGTHIVMRDCLLVYGRFVETICQSCVVSSLEKTRLAKLYAALLNAKMRACIDLLTGRPEPDGATELAIEEASLVVRAIAELLLVAHRCGNNISLPAIRGAVFAGIDDPLLSQEFYPMVDRAARIAAADAGISVAWMSVDYLPS